MKCVWTSTSPGSPSRPQKRRTSPASSAKVTSLVAPRGPVAALDLGDPALYEAAAVGSAEAAGATGAMR
ncbi:hypothetical protein GCM10022214_03920 [Actinomadura miaoliensis]|uniref:Uncharacterized protein n=1 Tax=Actinomadura miaoliensis TaxID=430685 RepID=A0ABP7UZX2_9ACTN